MIRIGVLTSGDRWHVEQLRLAAAGERAAIVPVSFRDLRVELRPNAPSRFALDTPRGERLDLAQLDALIIRAMPRGSLEQIVTRMNALAEFERQHGGLLVNPARVIEIAVDKYLCLEKVRQAGVPVPAAFVCERADVALRAVESMGDVIVKPLFGSRGRGLVRIRHDMAFAESCFQQMEQNEQVIYFQEFVDHGDSDIRLLVVGDHVLGMRRQRPGHWLTNIAQGAIALPHQVEPRERALARRIAQALGAPFLGIDLVYDERGGPKVIEVNASPGWKGLRSVVPDELDPPRLLIRWVIGHRCQAEGALERQAHLPSSP